MSIKYRPEIDGLRAIAVIAVILYHAKILIMGAPILSGGFIGVDIFFVISGYLISSIILREMNDGNFRFARFYERRARRILPALLTVMLISLPFAWHYIMPKGLSEYAGASLSALGFGSNIWFWLEDSYTAESSLLKPMLHTWTLAVEEQFYIIFPIIVMGFMALAKRYILGLFLIGFFISLEAAELASAPYPDATFYLLHTRFWELLAGAILAKIEMERSRDSHEVLHAVMPAFGLFLIAHALLSFEDTMRHPSFMTAAPVVGTMMIIWFARKGELVTDILSSRVFVGVGLISYSLYLWHYPVFAFARIDMGALSFMVQMACIALTFILAVISYYIIERPMRYKMPLNIFLPIIIVAVGIIATVNIYFIKTDGAKFRMDAYEGVFGGDMYGDWKECFTPERKLGEHCKYPREGAKGTIIGVGDSFLAVLGPDIRKMAEKLNMNYEQFPRCVLIKDTEILNEDNTIEPNTCMHEQMAALKNYENAIVIKSTRMTLRVEGTNRPSTVKKTIETSPIYLITQDKERDTTIEQAISAINEDILAMGHSLIQIYPVPEPGFLADYRLKKLLEGHEFDFKNRLHAVAQGKDMTFSFSDYRYWHARVISAYDAVAGEHYFKIIPHDIFCDAEADICNTVMDDHVLYRDTNHVSAYGAALIMDQVEAAITAQ
ncbi:MAG: acyltransferase family protein [Alphaproteobacteria bacterium]